MNTPPAASVAVVITAFNAETTIARAIESALNQTYDGPLRIVIVDDGSSDSTAQVARNFTDSRVDLVERGRLGRVGALNTALDSTRFAKYIANLDADDLMLPERITSQVATLESDPQIGVLGAGYFEAHMSPSDTLGQLYVVRPPSDEATFRKSLATHFPICHSCATYRREAAILSGGFNPLLRARIDFDLWLRMLSVGYQARNEDATLGVHLKRTGSYFDGQYSRFRSARQMARLNFIAASRLQLGLRGYAGATARLGYSLLRRQSVKRHPRYGEPVDRSSVEYELVKRLLAADQA